MLLYLAVLAYLVVLVCVFVVEWGYYKFPEAYGGGSAREPARTRRVLDPARDQYADLVKCPPQGPLVFKPEFASLEIPPETVRYFQTRLSMSREQLLECSTKFEFELDSCSEAPLVGFYVGHLEFFNTVASGTGHESEPFLVDARPDDVVTVSVRNRGAQPLRIRTWRVTFSPKQT